MFHHRRTPICESTSKLYASGEEVSAENRAISSGDEVHPLTFFICFFFIGLYAGESHPKGEKRRIFREKNACEGTEAAANCASRFSVVTTMKHG